MTARGWYRDEVGKAWARAVRASYIGIVPLLAACASASPPASPVGGAPRTVTGERFIVPIPDGYYDSTSELPAEKQARHTLALTAKEPTQGYRPTIVLQRTPVAARDQDPATCKEAGEGVAGAWTLRRAAIIAGPVGPACQMEIVAPQGVAIITELDLPDETWLMTCNHGGGDAAAERVCRATLGAIRASGR